MGVVYAPGSATTGLYGVPIALAAGAPIPPGQYFIDGAWSITAPGGSVHDMEAGYCVSDGTNATITAAGNAIPLGAGPAPVWPWPEPWPIGIT